MTATGSWTASTRRTSLPSPLTLFRVSASIAPDDARRWHHRQLAEPDNVFCPQLMQWQPTLSLLKDFRVGKQRRRFRKHAEYGLQDRLFEQRRIIFARGHRKVKDAMEASANTSSGRCQVPNSIRRSGDLDVLRKVAQTFRHRDGFIKCLSRGSPLFGFRISACGYTLSFQDNSRAQNLNRPFASFRCVSATFGCWSRIAIAAKQARPATF